MNSDIPKQFLPLSGEPVLMHSIRAFHEQDPATRIIVALPARLFDEWKILCERHSFDIPHELSEGGERRFDSVKNSLFFVTADGIVAVHDGARPLTGNGLISRAFDHALVHGNAVPFAPVTDSVRKTGKNSNMPLDRRELKLIQTPQVFLSTQILKAYQQEYNDSFTDDASVVEAAGFMISLIEGEPYNLKITFPEDLAIAEALLKFRNT
jgi:2-C-methyl-D-erythritol 4-phosphate cytidylyltransferase